MDNWTHHEGRPVYWLAPEFWDPVKGRIRLVLPGENPISITSAETQKRTVEFLKLQGDPRYCPPSTAARMRRLMRERLGSDTPWRGIEPQNVAEPVPGMEHPSEIQTDGFAQADPPPNL